MRARMTKPSGNVMSVSWYGWQALNKHVRAKNKKADK